MNNDVVALFCGAGGLSYGLSKSGLRPSFAADIDPSACATYSANVGTDAHTLDLGSVDRERLYRLLSTHRDCLAVVGGPPCQGFSTAGARNPADSRNQLVFRYLDIVDFLNPRWFIFENVEGILTSGKGQSIHDLLACFIGRGYTVRIEKINFAAYGLPQSRKRVIIMGNRVGADFELPPETHSYFAGKHYSRRPLPVGPNIMDAVGDLPLCADSDSFLSYSDAIPGEYGSLLRIGNVTKGVTLHFSTLRLPDFERIRLLKPGQSMHDLPEDCWHPSFRRRAFRRVMDGMPTEKRGGAPAGIKRLYADKCSPTITSAASREFIHPVEDRPLSLREAARLQSFPDAFNFTGGTGAIAVQIGNAIPPMVAEVFGRHLLALDGAFGSTRSPNSVIPGLLGYRLTDAEGMSPTLEHTQNLLMTLPRSEHSVKEGLFAF